MERFFAEAHVTPRIGMEMASNETIKQAVMAGLGIAFLSAHTVSAELADRRLVLLDLAGLPVVRQWFIVRLARRRLLPAAQALRQFLIDEGRQFLPQLPQHMSQNRQPVRAKRARQSGPKAKGSRNAD
jgi:LysR family transcriptional regulator for metE and metH